jgi:myosin heavy subunit
LLWAYSSRVLTCRVQGKAFSVDGIDDEKDFEEVCSAFKTISLDERSRDAMLDVIAAILHIGNLSFEPLDGDEERMKVSGESRLRLSTVSRLLQVDEETMEARLCSQSMTVRREVLVQYFDASAAEFNRDAFAKVGE